MSDSNIEPTALNKISKLKELGFDRDYYFNEYYTNRRAAENTTNPGLKYCTRSSEPFDSENNKILDLYDCGQTLYSKAA